MEFLQTFWTGPSHTNKENLIGMKAGWLSCEYHWMSWALSCLQAKKVFGEINLVTDEKGKEILVDLLGLPYDNISIELEGKLDHYHPALWALAKIYSYSIQTEPFLHLDGDVFIWSKPGNELLNARLIAQNLDKNLGMYRTALDEINEQFTHIPPLFLKDKYGQQDIYASNAGILGGNDPAFFKVYSQLAFEFIDKNKENWDKLNTGNLNFIFEQYLFCQLAAEQNITVSYYKGMVDDPIFKDYIKFEDFPHVDMIHPVGGFKRYQHVCDHLSKKLRRDYPEYYYHIVDIVRRSGAAMRSVVYNNSKLDLSLLPPLSDNHPAGPTGEKPSFERTRAVIKCLKNRYPNSEIPAPTEMPGDQFIEQVNFQLPDSSIKECLFEIHHLESEKNNYFEKLYADATNISALYAYELKTYQLIQDTLSLPETELMKIKISQSGNYLLQDLCWNWQFDHPEEIPAVAAKNLETEKASHPVLMVPHILKMGIKEFYFDDIDMIIFNKAEEICTISDLLIYMQQYFSQDEINENYNEFKKLIINSIKLLLYNAIVKIEINH